MLSCLIAASVLFIQDDAFLSVLLCVDERKLTVQFTITSVL